MQHHQSLTVQQRPTRLYQSIVGDLQLDVTRNIPAAASFSSDHELQVRVEPAPDAVC